MDDKSKAAADVEGLKSEIGDLVGSGNERALALASDEMLMSLDRAASNPEDLLIKNIEAELIANPGTYVHALETCDGNTRRCASLMLDHMVSLLRVGKAWPMVKSMSHFDHFCGPQGFAAHRRLSLSRQL